MSARSKNIIIIVQSILLLIGITFGLIYFGPRVVNRIESYIRAGQYISAGDDLSDIGLFDIEGNETGFSDKYKFIVYVSKDCSSCITHLPILKKLERTFFNDQNIELMLLWINGSPNKEITQYYGIENVSYQIFDTYLAAQYNTCFLLDPSNNVIATEKNNYEPILDIIIEMDLTDEDKLINNTNQYLKDYIVNNYTSKPDLIYFSMPGCPDCADANPIVYSDEIESVYKMTRIELVRGSAEHDIKDEYNIYKKIYKIDWYPSFLILRENNSWDIVRKVELNQLKEIILNHAE